jgi:glycolate oxidase subunit GlcD
MKFEKAHSDFFLGLLGEKGVKTNSVEVNEYAKDWTNPESVSASCVVLPKNTSELSKTLAYCYSNGFSVIPSGGRTGLAGGAVATKGEIILSLSRMNRILNIDATGLTIEVEAGVTTQALQEEAARHNLYYGIDLGSRGTCQIGGNLATNAGGLKFIRYGGTRDQVLGIEVVLADGNILDLNRALPKNNSGYNLIQLFVGSEGTLGVITKATLKLAKRPKSLHLACLSFESFERVSDCLALCHQEKLALTAFEFFTDKALDIVLKNFPNLKSPFLEKNPYFVILEIEEGDTSTVLESFLEKAFETKCILDAVLSSNSEEFRKLWALRENITESIARSGHVRKNDISVAVKDLPAFFKKIEPLTKSIKKNIELIYFGHVGDGNIHVNYSASSSISLKEFLDEALLIERKIFDFVHEFKGSISAEHGIGLNKKDEFLRTVSALEVSYMKEIKKIFDPRNILNPGKIFDL